MKIKKKYVEENFFKMIMLLSTIVIIFILLWIIGLIFIKGVQHISLDMLLKVPEGGYYLGKGGGILNAIVGSLYLSILSTILAIFISLPVALYMNVFLIDKPMVVKVIRFLLDLLWGIPSIVYGVFGFVIMIYFGLRASLLAGVIVVTLFIVPIMIRSLDEVFRMVSRGLIESSLSMGATESETAIKVVLRQSYSGFITAVLLSFGRGIGDAASVLFTTGFTDYIPGSLLEPAATLPLSIFFQLSSPIEEVRGKAYASAFVLTMVVLIISILSRYFSKRYSKGKINF